ncbi:MAG TPA: nucleotide exchange factor GrpE [Nitrospirae bacterium]|nr:nucleotide exchange factor GrpE [Nitrospirota bacterium]
MSGTKKEKISEDTGHPESAEEQPDVPVEEHQEDIETLKKELEEVKDKHLRLYADFDNYKRVISKEKEDLIKYSNEEFMRELLSVVDHLELALQHSSGSEAEPAALAEGVKLTLKELYAILAKFGLVSIESIGKPFDPFVHEAMTQIASEEHEENTVIEEFRKGYMLKDRVLRASLVGVSKKTN